MTAGRFSLISGSHGRSIVRFVGGAIAAIVSVTVAVSVLGAVGPWRSQGHVVSVNMGIGPPSSAGPFLAGRPVSLSAATTNTPFPVYRPTSQTASDALISHVWVQSLAADDGSVDYQVAVQYSSGIEVMLQKVAFDPATFYPTALAQLGSSQTSVQTVAGHVAAVIPQNIDATGANPASVAFVIGGVEVTLYGHVSTSQLLAIAATVSLPSG